MKDLTDIDAIKLIDPQDTLGSTEMAPQQMKEAWNQVQSLDLPKIERVKNLVFCGMGASIYGALVLKALQGPQMPYPMELVSDYHLPAWVNNQTLVVLTSYSGTTEEVLSCAQDALAKNAKIVVLTKGGPLAEFAKTNNVPAYIFDGKLNPAGVPRLGNGYTILGLIGLLDKTGVIDIEEKQIERAITRLKENVEDIKSKAMEDAKLYTNSVPIIFAAEHLSGNAQILRNQFNETSKTFSAYYLVPDLNHHLMEGLQFPTPSPLKFIILNSPNYSPKIVKRMQLTKDVLKKNKQTVVEFMSSGATVYDDFLEVITYGSYLTLYLALLHDQNPAVNPWVDWFKEELKK